MAKGQSKKENRIELAIIMVVAFMASYVFDISVIYIILACIGVGIVQYGISRKKTGGREDLFAIIFKLLKDRSV